MKHYNVSCAIIQNTDGKYYCCKRGPGRALENFWEFPGGKIECSELPSEALVREIEEELETKVKVKKYLGAKSHRYNGLTKYSDFSLTLHGFICTVEKGNLKLTEHTDFKWVSKEEIEELNLAPADRYFLTYL